MTKKQFNSAQALDKDSLALKVADLFCLALKEIRLVLHIKKISAISFLFIKFVL